MPCLFRLRVVDFPVQKLMVFGLVGPLRAGKSTVSEILSEYGFCVFSNSVVLRDILLSLDKPLQRDNFRIAGQVLFSHLGRDIIARGWLNQIANHESGSDFVIDGIRYPEEVKLFRKNLGNFKLVAVTSETRIRYLRARSSPEKENEKNETLDQFEEQSTYEIESYVNSLVKQADILIQNDDSKAELRRKVEQLVAR